MIDDHGLLGAVRDRGAGGNEGLIEVIKGWDIRGEDLVNLMRGRFSQFRHRKERRLFDMMDRDHTGYVTLEEIIAFREHHEEADELAGDVPLLTIQPDLTRSLVALYHFDVHLDGHLNFDEFILMQDYLQKVERTLEDEEVICCCIPKAWFKRKRVKKKRRGGARGAFEESSAPMYGNSERVIARKLNVNGQLENFVDEHGGGIEAENSMDSDSIQWGRQSSLGLQSPSPQTPGSPCAHDRHASFERVLEEEEEEEEEEELSADENDEFAAKQKSDEMDELQKQRRAMLVQTLKSNKGRKRFMEWLYRLADSGHNNYITEKELIVFLKAIAADGINPEVFVDPSEDCEGAIGSMSAIDRSERNVESNTTRLANDEAYLKDLSTRILERYDDSKTGTLLREEFMQLAAMVEREYELYHLNEEEGATGGTSSIGPYRLIRKLGKGAEGVVKLGINKETGMKKAVKIIKKGNIASMSRVDTEIEAMVVLDHPCVVSVDEVLETESNIFLVMEYCAGGHLEDYISPKRPMSSAAARYYFDQLVGGIVYCHSKGVCHRDLRVENLMLDNKGNLKITDFGHAGMFEVGWDVFQTMLVGSVSHLAPEQVTGTVYSGEKIDVWSAGIILYIMVTGMAPFQAESPEELLDLIRAAEFTNPEGIDDDCFEVIRETLQVEQDKRPTSVQLEEFAFISGPKEKLVLQHCEFKIESRVQSPVKWLQDLKNELKDVNVIVQEKRTGPEEGIDEEEHVDATVRTVEADEDEIRGQMGMRSISVHVLRCVHETQNVVFKVTVTMMSPDAGQQNPYPVVAFDLQSGEASIFQHIFRKIRVRYMHFLNKDASKMVLTRQVTDSTTALGGRPRLMSTNSQNSYDSNGEDAPLVNFAEVMGLQSSDSYRNVFAGANSPSLSMEKVFPWVLDRSTSQPMKSGRVSSLHRATSLRENR